MKKLNNILPDDDGGGRRIIGLSLGACAMFFLLLSRLWYLQVISAEDLIDQSENNRLRFVPVAAPRGAILDRNGKVLVSNTPSFSVAVIPQDVKNKEQLIDNLAHYLNLDRTEIETKWNKGQGRAKYYPLVVASGITRDQMEFLEENRLALSGVNIEMKPIRAYTNGSLASHLLGYLGEVSEDELNSERYREYNAGDYIGKSGIERAWESYLHGTDGGRQIEVDARGRFLRTVAETGSSVGNTVMLTIDLDLQKAAEQALGDQAGAAVAMDVNTGEILAFVSSPDFDPAHFTGRMPPEVWKKYLEDERHPLENKALKGMYPPGSTFKIITAIAGLEEGLIDEHTTIQCTGSYKFGNATFRCWDHKGHGSVDLKKSLRESCDVYYYKLAERLGVDRIAKYAKRFGLGAPLGIGLENEKAGVIPTQEWKLKRFGKKWYSGETLPVGIGQGYVLTTPVQLASMISTVANEGTILRPHLVKRVVDSDGKVLQDFAPQVLGKTGLKPATYRFVKEGLLAVINEAHGTGGASRLWEVKVAGKTGSSQVVKLRDSKGNIPYRFRDHALFVAFAPFEKPEIAVAVIVEHGEHGGSAAGPVSGKILRAYFEGKGVIKKPVPKSVPKEEEGGEGVAEPDTTGAAQQ
ncbi:penicillin-binding protein 2 [Geomonas sp. Red69]|uniref:Penicillin-binding protein 2 n=1 Tax=Geomonas diazotrophica TaxID=2843197 RepID=A0ABX8JLA3_9BACT|nr:MULTISPECIES: penicillin-binding protein 2 [Geomonas]MBU5636348.1 penicillin-binding protein 2 [Geomonas diazotrophica]QWV99155.1 penicillin-binding protein 2 [Geomonas nitrogeniifigens]QXE88323.1 penicillin-binding protein 2 [Geomonas nitrogeniifigens]